MRVNRVALAGATAALCSVPAGAMALASGKFAGQTVDVSAPKRVGTISFTVASGHLSRLVVTGEYVCGDGAGPGFTSKYRLTLSASERIRINRKGAFHFTGGAGRANVFLDGSVRGRTAKGTFDANMVRQNTFQCESYTTFTASLHG